MWEQVAAWVRERDGEVEFRQLEGDTATVALAAAQLGVSVDQVMKSLVFLAGDQPCLVIANGLHRVDDRKLAALTGVGRSKVRMASGEEALALTGFAIGVMPPFAHRTALRTFLDQRAADQPLLWGGTGDERVLLGLTPAELIRLTGAQTADLIR